MVTGFPGLSAPTPSTQLNVGAGLASSQCDVLLLGVLSALHNKLPLADVMPFFDMTFLVQCMD